MRQSLACIGGRYERDKLPLFRALARAVPLLLVVAAGGDRTLGAIDEGVERVMAALEQTGQLENTVVIFTSDQGYAWGQHGFAWKYAPYDANLKAPLLVRYPKRFPKGAVCEHPVGGHDVIPTFFELAGIELPRGNARSQHPSTAGRSSGRVGRADHALKLEARLRARFGRRHRRRLGGRSLVDFPAQG